MATDNANLILGVVGCSLWSQRNALLDEFQEKYSWVWFFHRECKYLETLSMMFIFHARSSQLNRKNKFIKSPVRQIAIAKNAYSAFTGSFPEAHSVISNSRFSWERILRSQLFLDFDTADNCHLNITTKKATTFQDGYLSGRYRNFQDQYVRVFDFTSMQVFTEILPYRNLVWIPLTPTVNFTFLLKILPNLMF